MGISDNGTDCSTKVPQQHPSKVSKEQFENSFKSQKYQQTEIDDLISRRSKIDGNSSINNRQNVTQPV